MRILVAPDSFKGSLSGMQICNIVEDAAKEVFDKVDVMKIPVADGGEGTVDSVIDALSGIRKSIRVKNALGEIINASYGVFHGDKAIIEMASASGLPLIPIDRRNVMISNTYGTGELILDAITSGCKIIYLGIGGSATNDGGIGCLNALGVKFLDVDGKELTPIPNNFLLINEIDTSQVSDLLAEVQIILLCDVQNPLLGKTGATQVYGRQKGATESQIELLERGLEYYISLVEKTTGKEVTETSGAGAAGGLGAGLLSFTCAKRQSGVETILEIIGFEQLLQNTDLVITGEGNMDYQSAFGKVAYGVGQISKRYNIPCAAIVGGMGKDAEVMYNHGIETIVTTVNGILELEEAIGRDKELCYSAALRLFRGIKIGMSIENSNKE